MGQLIRENRTRNFAPWSGSTDLTQAILREQVGAEVRQTVAILASAYFPGRRCGDRFERVVLEPADVGPVGDDEPAWGRECVNESGFGVSVWRDLRRVSAVVNECLQREVFRPEPPDHPPLVASWIGLPNRESSIERIGSVEYGHVITR